jgi:hypothetical protein
VFGSRRNRNRVGANTRLIVRLSIKACMIHIGGWVCVGGGGVVRDVIERV